MVFAFPEQPANSYQEPILSHRPRRAYIRCEYPISKRAQVALHRKTDETEAPRRRAVADSGTATMPAESRHAWSMPVGRSRTFREPSAIDIVVEPTPGLRSHDPHPATQGFRLVRGLCRK